jgi:hypothetical protein
MKGIHFVEESYRKAEPAFTDDEISTLCMCLAAFMTVIVFIQVLIIW